MMLKVYNQAISTVRKLWALGAQTVENNNHTYGKEQQSSPAPSEDPILHASSKPRPL